MQVIFFVIGQHMLTCTVRWSRRRVSIPISILGPTESAGLQQQEEKTCPFDCGKPHGAQHVLV